MSYLAIVGCVVLVVAGSAQGADRPSPEHGGMGGPVVPPHKIVFAHLFTSPCDYVPFCAQLDYHGGPVMHQTTTHAIYWLPTGYTSGDGMSPYDTNYQSVIDQYFTDLAAASGTLGNVYGVATQYYDNPGQVPITTNQVNGGSYVDTSTPFPADGCTDPTLEAAHCLTDAQLETEIDHVISVKSWPKGTSNIYFIFTPEGVESCFDALGTACGYTEYCAYHSYYGSGSSTVVYANEPYPKLNNDPFAECGVGNYPNGDDADEALNVASHEHNEAITDPTPGAALDGWYADANGGYENGDQCAWYFGTESGSSGAKYNQTINSNHYDLQLEWSNDGSVCLASYSAPTPTLTSFKPSGGVSGTKVAIKGTNFGGTTAVKFNGVNATSFVLKGTTQITAVVPPTATTGLITVTTGAGDGTSAGNFTILPPIVTKVNPSHGVIGQPVKFSGSSLVGVSGVTFNGTVASYVPSSKGKSLTAVVPVGTSTGPVHVTTIGGSTAGPTFTLDPSPQPTVKSFKPTSAHVGDTITISGKYFYGTSAVKVNGVNFQSFVIVSSTKITAVVAGGNTTGTISVTTPGGTATTVTNLTIS